MLKFSNATPSMPVVGCTVGTENWFWSQSVGDPVPNLQNAAVPLIAFGGDHDLAWSSE